MNKEDLHQFIDDYYDQFMRETVPQEPEVSFDKPTADTVEIDEAVTVDKPTSDPDTRVVRSKGTGDKVYLLNDKEMTKRWITSPAVLEGLGFGMGDVGEVADMDLAKYKPVSAAFNAS